MARGDRYGSRDIYTGGMSEVDMLGKCKLDKAAYVAEYKALATKDGYLRLDVAMDLIRKHYQGDPHAPEKPFAAQLRMAIAEGLGLDETNDGMDRLKYYSAVQSGALDFKHGVDGWMEIAPKDGKGKSKKLMIDVTKRDLEDKPDDTHTPDRLVVSRVPDVGDGTEEFLNIVYDVYGAKAVAKFQEQGIQI